MSLKSVPIWETSRIATKDMDTAVGSVSEGRVMCNRVFQKYKISLFVNGDKNVSVYGPYEAYQK